MATYCRDCVTWVNSRDANRYGEKWCDYDRKYRKPDQPIYGCRGFIWIGRVIITKVCEILNVDPKPYFDAFDDTKEIYIIPSCVDKLIDYNTVGPVIAEKLDKCSAKEQIANNILKTYIKPAYEKCLEKDYQGAVTTYEYMIKVLAVMLNATKKSIEETRMFDDLLKVGPLMETDKRVKK